jgi:hypothetical protein
MFFMSFICQSQVPPDAWATRYNACTPSLSTSFIEPHTRPTRFSLPYSQVQGSVLVYKDPLTVCTCSFSPFPFGMANLKVTDAKLSYRAVTRSGSESCPVELRFHCLPRRSLVPQLGPLRVPLSRGALLACHSLLPSPPFPLKSHPRRTRR